VKLRSPPKKARLMTPICMGGQPGEDRARRDLARQATEGKA